MSICNCAVSPTYHDYVLYNHNEGDAGKRKYWSRSEALCWLAERWMLAEETSTCLGTRYMTYSFPISHLLVQALPITLAKSLILQIQMQWSLPCLLIPQMLHQCHMTCHVLTWTWPVTPQRFLQQMMVVLGSKQTVVDSYEECFYRERSIKRVMGSSGKPHLLNCVVILVLVYPCPPLFLLIKQLEIIFSHSWKILQLAWWKGCWTWLFMVCRNSIRHFRHF